MPGFVATVANVVMCSHAGKATPAPLPVPVRVFIMGIPVVTLSSSFVIAGCGLTPTGSPFCATGTFTSGSTRVFASIGAAMPAPLLVIPNAGTCAPTGQPLIPVPAGQQRVVAS